MSNFDVLKTSWEGTVNDITKAAVDKDDPYFASLLAACIIYEEFKEQLTRDETGRYETGLPWRANHPPLPNNRVGSMRRLTSLTSKLDREGLRSKYNEILQEQRLDGIIESANNPSKGVEFYIPYKPVIRSCAETTKIRVVYDASARAHNAALH